MRLVCCFGYDAEIRSESATRDRNGFKTLLGKLDLDNNNLIWHHSNYEEDIIQTHKEVLRNAGFQGNFKVYNAKANI